MKQINADNYEEIYADMKINLDALGCLMLKVDGKSIPTIDPDYLYQTKDEGKFWVKGFVAGNNPHMTILFGLMKPAIEYKPQIQQLLKDWEMPTVTIERVNYFPSPYLDEPYSCIIAHLEVTPKLLEAHQKMQLLPHIDTYPEYKPHVTIAYIKDDERIRNEVIEFYNHALKGKTLKTLGLDYGEIK